MKDYQTELTTYVETLNWENAAQKQKAMGMASLYEADFNANRLLRPSQLAEKHTEYTSKEWLDFLMNKKISSQRLLLVRFNADLIMERLNSKVDNELLTILEGDKILDKQEITQLQFLIKHLSTTTQKQTKVLQDMIDSQNKTHTFIFNAPADSDNMFRWDTDTGYSGESESLFYTIEVYDKDTNEFVGFMYLQPSNIPSINKHKASFVKEKTYEKKIRTWKQQCAKYSLKTHKVVVPKNMYLGIEEVNVKNNI